MCSCPTRRTGDVEYISLLGGIGYVLELAVVGYLELSKLLNETVLIFVVVGIAREVVRHADEHSVVFSAFYLGEGTSYLVEAKQYYQYEKLMYSIFIMKEKAENPSEIQPRLLRNVTLSDLRR